MKLMTMAWRNVRRNSRRTALSATAIGLAALTLILLFSLLAGLTQEMSHNLRTFYSGEIRLRHAQYDDFAHLNPLHLNVANASVLIQDILSLETIESVNARTPFPASIYQDGENLNAPGMGMNMEGDSMTPDRFLVSGRLPKAGQREVLLGTRLAQDLDMGINDRFTALSMTMRRASNGMTFTVVGIVSFPIGDLNRSFYAPIDTVQRFLKLGDRTIDLTVKPQAEMDLNLIKKQIQQILDQYQLTDINIERWDEISTTYAYLSLARLVYFIMGLVFYLLASTVIINTMMMVIFERTKEIGTLASLGMEPGPIVRMFLLEAMIISLIGSLAGTIIGSIITWILQNTGIDMTQSMQGIDFEISGVVYPRLTAFNMLYAFTTGVIVASLASLIPSRRAAKIKPVVAMQSL